MAAPLLDEDAEGARIRGAVNGAGAHAPASRTIDDLEWEVSDLRAQVADRDARIRELERELRIAGWAPVDNAEELGAARARKRAQKAEAALRVERSRVAQAEAARKASNARVDEVRAQDAVTIRGLLKQVADAELRATQAEVGRIDAEREAARLRGCEAVEGDYVCGHDAYARDLEARLAAAARASASIPAPGGGPWSEPDVAGWLDGYASAADARAAGHHLPAVMTDPASAISWLCSGCGGAIGGCGYCLSSATTAPTEWVCSSHR